MAWRSKHGVEQIDPIVEAAVKYLKEKGFKKIGAVGYCFGGKYVCRFLNGRGVDVGYSAHPVSQSDSLGKCQISHWLTHELVSHSSPKKNCGISKAP